eukprot:gi/632985863/ref/XP_007909919.1/ PREDICTED: neuropeptides capa receptor-like [Callorhinchus milii]
MTVNSALLDPGGKEGYGEDGSQRVLAMAIFENSKMNLVAIVILSRRKCGLSRCITLYLLAMAVGDLMVVIFDVIFYRIGYLYFPGSFLNLTTVCRANIFLLTVSTECSVWFTVAFTFDRFVAICRQKLGKRYCSEKTATRVLGALLIVNCLKGTATHFVFGAQYEINGVSWGCVLNPSFGSSLGWKVCTFIFYIWNPSLPFLLILLCNALTVRYILAASLVRKRLRNQVNAAQSKDTELESRKKSVILLLTVSGSFILLWMTYFVNGIYGRITVKYYYTSLEDPLFIAQQVGIMLQLLSCGTNTCIYVVSQRKFREELKRGVTFPLTLFLKMLNKANR